MQFLQPMMLAGLALASVPLILHLLNRRRFRVVQWAPMEYLRLTIKTNRPRMRIERWLLLLLRTLLIVALIVALARPAVTSGVAEWMASWTPTDHCVVLDDSLSMDQHGGEKRAWERGLDAVETLVRQLGAGGTLTVVRASAPDTPLLSRAPLIERDELIARLRGTRRSDVASDWPGALDAVRRLIERDVPSARRIAIITDLRRSGWSEGVRETSRWWEREGRKVLVIDVGSEAAVNVALLDLLQESPAALPHQSCRFSVRIRNHTPERIEALPATVRWGGQVRTVLLPELTAGAEGRTDFSLSFDRPGAHIVTVGIPEDALPADNVRRVRVDVRERLEVLMVDGDVRHEPFESETDYLGLAFALGGDAWRVSRVAEADWSGDASGDLVVLANVASLSSARAETLRRAVTGGAAVFIFMGEHVSPEGWNARWDSQATRLLPARLEGVQEGPLLGIAVEPVDRSPLQALTGLAPSALARIPVARFMRVISEEGDSAVRVLARWNDGRASPAVIERRIGSGVVLLWTITADRAWSDWPVDPTYPLAIREAALQAADGRRPSGVAGRPLPLEGLITAEHGAMRLTSPGSDTSVALSLPTEGPLELAAGATSLAGVYTIEWNDSAGAARAEPLAVNPPAVESEPLRIRPERLAALWSADNLRIVRAEAMESAAAGRSHELWRTFALAVVAMIVVESLLALYVGRQR